MVNLNKNGKISITIIIIICLCLALSPSLLKPDEPLDARELADKASKVLDEVKSYRFFLSVNLSSPVTNEKIEIIRGQGEIDYKNHKAITLMRFMNRSVETIIIDESIYVREADGDWYSQPDTGSFGVWAKANDQLSQQQVILSRAVNISMKEYEHGWILEVIPEKSKVLDQLRKTRAGLDTLKDEELRSYKVRYWIEKDTYYITQIENTAEIEMNIQGLVTIIKLESKMYLFDFNEEIEVVSPNPT